MSERFLSGRTALVTGASRGIGRATAVALATAGADVALAYGSGIKEVERVSSEVREHGARAVVLAADLSDATAAAGLVERTVTELGALDIVVNNAGIARDGLAVRLRDHDWADVIAVDLTAVFYICRAALRPMLRKRFGRIVNVSSVSGVMGFNIRRSIKSSG